jgi:hypothetical protein
VVAVIRRPSALVALAAFLAFTVVAIVVSGNRPALQQGIAPTVLQLAGYLCALLGAVQLLAGVPAGRDRATGAAVLAALAVLVLLEVTVDDGGGANIGAGFVRLVCLLVIVVLTARLTGTVAAARRR